MQKFNLKCFVLLFGLLLPAAWYGAYGTSSMDGHSHILIKEGNVQGTPKGSAIQASINGHMLIVVFSENLGQVSIEVATATGTPMDCLSTQTPNGVNLYVPHAGDYVEGKSDLFQGQHWWAFYHKVTVKLGQIIVPNDNPINY